MRYVWEYWATNPPKYCRLIRIEDDGSQAVILSAAPGQDHLDLSEEHAALIVGALNAPASHSKYPS